MRIAFVSRMFPHPGRQVAGVFVLEQAKAVAKRGIEVEVICPIPFPFYMPSAWMETKTIGRTRVSSLDGLRVTYMSYPHVAVKLSSTLESRSLATHLGGVVRGLHRDKRIDVLHAHALFPTGYATTVIGRRLGIPVVCTAHGSDVHTHPLRNRGIARITRATIRTADRIVAVSEDLRSRICRLEPENNGIEVIYSGVDPSRFGIRSASPRLRSDLGLPEDGVGICTVSRLDVAKGIPELMKVFEVLHRKVPGAWLLIVGDGPLDGQVREWAARFAGRVFVAGAVPHSAVSEYLNAADVFVLPSHREGVPVAILEAMACGLPVVSTSVGGIPEVVMDSVTGYLVEVGDLSALSAKLEQLINEPELRRRMAARARALVHDRFLWRHGAERLEDVYRQVTEGNR